MKKQQLVKIQTYGEHTFEPVDIVCAIPMYDNILAQRIYLCVLKFLFQVELGSECEVKIPVYTKEIGETNYLRIKQAIDLLAKITLTWSSKERKEFKIFAIFPTIKYKQLSGVITIYVNPQLIDEYKGLVEKGYTKHKLSTILGLQKLYS
jgi:plasmid replication initiation protein